MSRIQAIIRWAMPQWLTDELFLVGIAAGMDIERQKQGGAKEVRLNLCPKGFGRHATLNSLIFPEGWEKHTAAHRLRQADQVSAAGVRLLEFLHKTVATNGEGQVQVSTRNVELAEMLTARINELRDAVVAYGVPAGQGEAG